MLRVEVGKWRQTREDVAARVVNAADKHTRQRWLVIMAALNNRGATQAAKQVGVRPKFAMKWIRVYNAKGPEALTWRHTGGIPPLCPPSKKPSSRS